MNKASSTTQKIVETITTGFGDQSERVYYQGKFLGKGGFAKCYELTVEENSTVLASKVIEKSSIKKTRQRQKVMS